jgi:hypothetical protein
MAAPTATLIPFFIQTFLPTATLSSTQGAETLLLSHKMTTPLSERLTDASLAGLASWARARTRVSETGTVPPAVPRENQPEEIVKLCSRLQGVSSPV